MTPEDPTPQELRPYHAPDSTLTGDQGPSPPWDESVKRRIESLLRWFVGSAFVAACVHHTTNNALMLLDELLNGNEPYMTEMYFELRFYHQFVLVVVWGVLGLLITLLFSKATVYFLYRITSVATVENHLRRYSQSILGHPLAIAGTFVLAVLVLHLFDVSIELLAQGGSIGFTGALTGAAAAPIALAASYPVFKVAMRKVRESLECLGSMN